MILLGSDQGSNVIGGARIAVMKSFHQFRSIPAYTGVTGSKGSGSVYREMMRHVFQIGKCRVKGYGRKREASEVG